LVQSGFALAASCFALRRHKSGYAVTGFVLNLGLRTKPGGPPGTRTRRRQRWWFKAHPKEEPMNHSLTVGRHRARRARVTRDHRI